MAKNAVRIFRGVCHRGFVWRPAKSVIFAGRVPLRDSDLAQHARDHRVLEARGYALGLFDGALVRQQCQEFNGRQRRAAQITLVLIAAQRAQERQLFLGLDPFRNHFQVQAVGE